MNTNRYSEMRFLFDSKETYNFNNSDNFDNIYKNYGSAEYPRDVGDGKKVVLAKQYRTNDPKYEGTSGIKQWYAEKININSEYEQNPYLKLIRDFNRNEHTALRLDYADIAYLKDLGVYPLNRLIILKRFKENLTLPSNLSSVDGNASFIPISTIIGWVKTDNDSLLSISFNEEWDVTKNMLHEELGQIIKNEFGIIGSKTVPVPGWSQGILFGFFRAMGLTDDYSLTQLPFGDPNVLQEAAIRGGTAGGKTDFSLKSNFNFSFETVYEQKFIGDIDPGAAMQDFFNNAVRMGTSDVKYIFTGNSEIIKSLRTAAVTNELADWANAIKTIVVKFIGAIRDLISSTVDFIVDDEEDTNTGDKAENQDKGGANKANKYSNTLATTGDKIKTVASGAMQSILAATVAKYRWPLIGAIAVMTGEDTTPWHLTIGNPYNPVVSLNHVIVEKVTVDFSNELGFNDMPKRMKVTCDCALSRNLGGQELRSIFNNNYLRKKLSDNSEIVEIAKKFAEGEKTDYNNKGYGIKYDDNQTK